MADYRIDQAGLRPGYPLSKLGQSGATSGQVPVWNATTGQWEPGTAAGGGGGSKILPFKATGTLAVVTGKTKFRNIGTATLTITAIQIDVETAPSGGSVVVDVNKNGTTIFTTQANRPTITTGNTASSVVTNMDITTVAPGDYLTIDVDTATAPSANLTVTIALT